MEPQKRLFLLDAYALIYRSYYAFIKNPRINSKKFNTSAIFGFTRTLNEVIKKYSPTHIAVAFDPPGPTFRHNMFIEYKANRHETPEDIKNAVPYIKKIIEGFNIPIIEVPGYEADDVIGTLAKIAENNGFKTFMMTSDKDYTQLVSENIFILKPKHSGNDEEIWGVKEVQESFGINNPLQVIDIMALWGDSSDNIPGAPGIGEKSAKKLIAEYGSIENLFNNTSALKGKQQEIIINNIDQIKLSKKLVTILLNVPCNFEENKLKIEAPDKKKLQAVFEELEFKTLLNEIVGTVPIKKSNEIAIQGTLFGNTEPIESPTPSSFSTINSVEHSYHLVDSPEKRKNLIEQLGKLTSFCFDTETTSLDVHSAKLAGIAFAFKNKEAYYVLFPENQEKAQEVANEFKGVFENPVISKIGQNIKFDILILKNYGIEVAGELFDTMLAHYLIEPEQRHNLTFLAEKFLNYTPVPIEDLIGKKGKTQLNIQTVEVEKVKEYACEDADITWQLKDILEKELKKGSLFDLFKTIETPLVPVLADMEKAGVKLDTGSLNAFASSLKNEIIKIENEIIALAGEPFNISSPKQLGKILFDKLKIIDTAKKTKTKQYSTGEEILQKLKDKHEIIPKILDHRSLKKLLTTYVESLPRLIAPKTKKIHTSYNQAVASTGRLSSNNPNLQNIPIREEKGREIRKAFIPSDNNYVLLSADYSQVELRLMAHLSGDPNMINAFNNNEDIHAATAAKIFNVPTTEVTKEMRGKAKTANFGIIYGISTFGLSERLNISRKEAKELIDGYFNTYPKVKEYMDKSIEIAREKGYVTTILGRKRQLSDINSVNAIVRGFAERNAINAPLQGSAADIIKIAMIKIHQQLKSKNYTSKMILQVHDELVFDTLREELEEIKKIVIDSMQNAIHLKVPLIVETGVGENWLEAH